MEGMQESPFLKASYPMLNAFMLISRICLGGLASPLESNYTDTMSVAQVDL